MCLSKELLKLAAVIQFGCLLLGCQAAFSKEIRAQVDETLAFEQVLSDPEAYRGKLVLWGGEILKVRNAKEEAFLEVLEHPLDYNDRPRLREMPRGRFLMAHKGFLDPAIFHPGQEITIIGEVIGKREETLDEIEYTYPVVEDRELVLWGPRYRGPSFHIGIGATFLR